MPPYGRFANRACSRTVSVVAPASVPVPFLRADGPGARIRKGRIIRPPLARVAHDVCHPQAFKERSRKGTGTESGATQKNQAPRLAFHAGVPPFASTTSAFCSKPYRE